MSDIAIQVDHVWKKFRKGELHDSLRELIPAVARRLLGKSPKNQDLQDREFWALKDVSFEVKRGESLGIIGPNGAGKSTMLKLLSRIIRPNKGEYKVNGRLSALIEVGAGFHQDLTGRENIYLNGTILGMSKKEIKAKEEQIIDFSGVEAFIETPVKRYSSGMTARLGFAVAAHMEPDVLLVDEVLSVGDARFRQKCIQHMQELITSNVTVVFISHILEQVRQLCPNTLVLNHGAVHFHGNTSDAIQHYLDILDDVESDAGDGSESAVAVPSVCFKNENGDEVLGWTKDDSPVIELDLDIRKPCGNLAVVMNVSSLGGTHLATIHSRRLGFRLAGTAGRHTLTFRSGPLPLTDGDYNINLQIHEYAGEYEDGNVGVIWSSTTPRIFRLSDTGSTGGIARIDGTWESKTQLSSPELVVQAVDGR